MKQHIYEFFANLIIEGSFLFKNLSKKLRPGVKKALKDKGREDLATDSNATNTEQLRSS